MYNINHKKNKKSSQQTNNIETLLERLDFLKIMNKASNEMNKRLNKEMSVASAPVMMNNNV